MVSPSCKVTDITQIPWWIVQKLIQGCTVLPYDSAISWIYWMNFGSLLFLILDCMRCLITIDFSMAAVALSPAKLSSTVFLHNSNHRSKWASVNAIFLFRSMCFNMGLPLYTALWNRTDSQKSYMTGICRSQINSIVSVKICPITSSFKTIW